MWMSGKMRLLKISILVIIAMPVLAGIQAQYYVSPDGSDNNPGSLELPFATIEKARDIIRTVNDTMTGDIVVNIKSGRYFVDSTIEFTDADSGTNGFSIIYKNYNQPGSASFVGGRIVSNWQLHQGQIYYADVGSVDFHTLYENGKRVRKARTPNYVNSDKHPVAQANYLRATGVNGSRTSLQYGSGDLDPAGWNLDDAQVYMWPGGKWAWFTDTTPIASIDTNTRTIMLEEQTRYPIYQSGNGSRYFVQGVLELLDQPGEFHYDISAGRLYYWAMDGVITQQEIIIPTVKRIVSVIGSDDSHIVGNMRFEGLRFEVSDFTGWYRHAYPSAGDSGEVHQYPQYDRQRTMPQHRTGMIYLENTKHLVFKDCVIRNAGYSGIYCNEYNQNNRFEGNWISHTGQSGIFFEGRYPGEGNVLKNNVITNCLIHDIGELAGQAGAVNIMNSSDNEVSYCDIYNGTRYAVLIAAYVDIPFADIYAYGNHVKYLNIHNFCQDSGDTAPIYIWGASDDPPYHKNYYEQLRIDDISAHPSMPDIAPNGVFMDNDAHGQSFTNIHVTRTQGGQFRTNDSGSHVFTNVSWQGGFDEKLMEPDNIGINSSFLYPVAVGGLNYTYDKTGIALSWDPVRNAASYSVYRSVSKEGPFVIIADSVTATNDKDTDA
ncbi:MAG: right-handed parallel beta-helix repeat-containing protein, partial [Anaerohalosphaera sp.]|nr:right-handed parallel beta-helix repeat-containing protein [Anaerohalosphaera sp.]